MVQNRQESGKMYWVHLLILLTHLLALIVALLIPQAVLICLLARSFTPELVGK